MKSSSRNGARVRVFCLHTTEGILRADDLRAFFNRGAATGSSHAGADADGRLLSGAPDGYVDYNRAAWTLRNGNPWSDNLEMCGWAKWARSDWLARPKLLEAAAQWLAERHRARPWIPLRRLTVAELRAGAAGVIDHDTYTKAYRDGTHWDVGVGFPWDIVLARANQIVNGDDMPTAREVADALLDTEIKRMGPGAAGTTTPRAIFQWLDANIGGIPDAILARDVPRAGGREGTTNLGQTIAWLDANLTEIKTAAASGDPAAVAAAIPAGIAQQVVDLLAQRLAA